MNGLLIFLAGTLSQGASSNDEKAIRQLYSLRDRCYVRADAKTLATTELPDYFAVTYDKKVVPNDRIKQHLKWRFGGQISCKRTENPIYIKISGETATVQVKISDVFVVQDKNKAKTKNTRIEEGTARWLKMPEGWKLESFQFKKIEWIDEKGKWQVAPKPKISVSLGDLSTMPRRRVPVQALTPNLTVHCPVTICEWVPTTSTTS